MDKNICHRLNCPIDNDKCIFNNINYCPDGGEKVKCCYECENVQKVCKIYNEDEFTILLKREIIENETTRKRIMFKS